MAARKKPIPVSVPRRVFVEVTKGRPDGITKLEDEAAEWAAAGVGPLYEYVLVRRFKPTARSKRKYGLG